MFDVRFAPKLSALRDHRCPVGELAHGLRSSRCSLGKPVITHTIAAFEATPSVAEMIVVRREERLSELRDLVARECFEKIAQVTVSGEQR